MCLWVWECIQRTLAPVLQENVCCCRWQTAGFGGVSGRPVLIILGEMLPGLDVYSFLPPLHPLDLRDGTENVLGIALDLSH